MTQTASIWWAIPPATTTCPSPSPRDNIMISVLSVVFVIIVLLFTFQSVGLPILLILVIQGSIWLNFSFSGVTQKPIFFMSSLIVTAIQMGANIDYAIVISSWYAELKGRMPGREAIIQALNLAFPTVLTSGSILSAAGIPDCPHHHGARHCGHR